MVEIATGDRLLRVREVADLIALRDQSVYDLIAEGKLRAVRPSPGGKGLRVPASEVDRYIAELPRGR